MIGLCNNSEIIKMVLVINLIDTHTSIFDFYPIDNTQLRQTSRETRYHHAQSY